MCLQAQIYLPAYKALILASLALFSLYGAHPTGRELKGIDKEMPEVATKRGMVTDYTTTAKEKGALRGSPMG
jgi:hypothetical protein